jgi:hypothetical protein
VQDEKLLPCLSFEKICTSLLMEELCLAYVLPKKNCRSLSLKELCLAYLFVKLVQQPCLAYQRGSTTLSWS